LILQQFIYICTFLCTFKQWTTLGYTCHEDSVFIRNLIEKLYADLMPVMSTEVFAV